MAPASDATAALRGDGATPERYVMAGSSLRARRSHPKPRRPWLVGLLRSQ